MPQLRERLQSSLGSAYVIERELGGGGMSRVFVAEEKSLGRKVVVKVLPPELGAGINIDRFRREIMLAAQLQHPHIVPLLSAGEANDLLYYTMPFIEGESLRAALSQRGPFAVRDVVRVLHDVVDALAYAHGRGVIHRDIKPANVLSHGTHALVTDFGVAKAVSAALPHSGTTSAGLAIGTPAYMAPEQLAADPNADHRMDLYAVGLLAYELLRGESPFTGTSPQATMAAQLTYTPPPINEVRDDVPAELSAVIMKCLEKQPEARWESAQSLLDALDEVATPIGGRSSISSPRGSGISPTRRWRMPIGLTVTALVLVSVLVARRGRSGTAPHLTDSAPPAAATPAPALAPSAAPGGTSTSGAMLSHDDSVAIADAIRRRSARPAAEPIARDSLIATFQRVIAESVRVAMQSLREQQISEAKTEALRGMQAAAQATASLRKTGAADMKQVFIVPHPAEPAAPSTAVVPSLLPPSSGRQRVVVGPFRNATGKRVMTELGDPLADSLRISLARSGGAFDVVDASTTREAVAEVGTSTIALGWRLRADLAINGIYYLRNDSLVLLATISDVKRGRNIRASEAPATTLDAPFSVLPALTGRIMKDLTGVLSPDAPERRARPGSGSGASVGPTPPTLYVPKPPTP